MCVKHQARDSANPAELSVSAATTLLPAGGFYDCHFGCHLLALFHAADDHHVAIGHEQAAMVHRWIGVFSLMVSHFWV